MRRGNSERKEKKSGRSSSQRGPPLSPPNRCRKSPQAPLPSSLRRLPSSGSRDTPLFLYVLPPLLAPPLSLPSPGSPPLVSRDEVRAGGAAAAAAAVEVTEAVAAEAAPSAVSAPVRPKSR